MPCREMDTKQLDSQMSTVSAAGTSGPAIHGTETPQAQLATRDIPVLAIATVPASLSRFSGYHRLVDYVPEVQSVTVPRCRARTIAGRAAMRVTRAYAFTRWYELSCISLEWQVWNRLRESERSVIHALWADHDLGFLDRAVRRGRDGLIGTFHSCYDDLTNTLRHPKRLRRFDALILMSHSQRKFFVAHGVSPSRLFVIHHGVDTTHFAPPLSRPDDFTVLSVGGHRRNFAELRAVCQELQGHRDIRFRIVAPESHAPLFADLENVLFQSGLSEESLLQAYHGASCLLLTADDATANNALLEGMACGLPVVAERVGGIPEYVDAASAILVERQNTAGLARSIMSLKASASTRGEMGEAARARASVFDWRVVARVTAEVYANVSFSLSKWV